MEPFIAAGSLLIALTPRAEEDGVTTATVPNTTTPTNQPAERSSVLSPYPQGNWLYALKAGEFIELAADGQTIADLLAEHHQDVLGLPAGDGEHHSWQQSLPALAQVLAAAGLKEQMVILEYCPPSRDTLPSRIDAVICGADKAGHLQAVFIELKQWSSLPMAPSALPGHLFIHRQGQWKHVLHPRKQAEEYRKHMQEVLKLCGLPADFLLFSAYAFLHNAANLSGKKKDILFGHSEAFDEDSRLYTSEYASALSSRLQERVGQGEGERAFAAFQDLQRHALQHVDQLPKRLSTMLYEQRKAYAISLRVRIWREKLGVFLVLVLLPTALIIGFFWWLLSSD